MILLYGRVSRAPGRLLISKFALFSLIAFLCAWSSSATIPLDPIFNSGAGTGAETGFSAYAEHVLSLADGKILVSGVFKTYNGEAAPFIVRLNEDGTLDHTFQTGVVNNWVRHMAVQDDGKIIVGGAFSAVGGAPRNLIARLNADGSHDPSFDPGLGFEEKLVPGDPNPPFIFWFALQPDGKIVLTGSFAKFNGRPARGIIRLNPDGTRDESFNFGFGLDSWGRSVAVQPNGQVLLTGWFLTYNGFGCNRMVLINQDGTPDASFHPFFGDATAIYSAALLSDGKRIVSGHTKNELGLFMRKIARLNIDGTEDSEFVANTGDRTECVMIQPDGKILASGWFDTVNNGTPRSRLARFNADGTLDNDFSIDCNGFIWTMAVDAKGRLLIAGGFNEVNGVARQGIARLSANIPIGPAQSGETNHPPTASNFTLRTVENAPVAVRLAGNDPDGDPTTFQIISPPGKGLLSGSSSEFTYTPDPGTFGEDSFTYVVSDGKAQSAPVQVTIQVQPAPENISPLASNLEVEMKEGNSLVVRLGGSDDDGDPITFRIVTLPNDGEITGTEPAVTYTPKPGFIGRDGFTYVISDGKTESAPATVTILVRPLNVRHRIRELRVETDGSITLQFEGPPLETFQVVCSEDGKNWLSLGEGSAKEDGAGEFRDPSGRERARFYRAVWP